MNILGIETSCDETAAAVVSDGRIIRSNVISSQIALHQSHGGVVPELAARGHVRAIIPVVETALAEAGIGRRDIDAIAVTEGPGLAGSLLVGVNVAKTLAYLLGRPLIPVNHLEAHIYANWLNRADQEMLDAPTFPLICLLVSGGHSELMLMTGHGRYQHLGRTRDDAAGEAFDKGARLLGLGYPGGPAIQRAATGADSTRFDLPRSWLGDSYDFSFSGLKTALLRIVEPYRLPATPQPPRAAGQFAEHRPPAYTDDLPAGDLAAAYQDAVIDVLATKTVRAVQAFGATMVVLAGGVAANSALRSRIVREIDTTLGPNAIPVRYPPIVLCTDNAAMVAGAAYFAMRRGTQAGWEADIHPRLPLVPDQGVTLGGRD